MTKQDKLVTKNYYDINAGYWAANRSHFDASRQRFDKFQELLPSGKILDLGCGTGRDAQLFIPAGYDYIGIDLSDGMIAQAKKLFPDAKFEVMDMTNLAFENEVFDGLWAFTSYLHIPKTEIAKAVAESNRVLKMGGIGYVTIKKGSGEKYIGEADSKRYWSFYGKNQFAKVLRDGGFEIIESWEDKRIYNPPKDVSVFICYIVRKIK